MRVSSTHILVNLYVDGKRVEADIDYNRQLLYIRSLFWTTNAPAVLTATDIIAFQKLLVTLPAEVNSESAHGDALLTVINLLASAPVGNAINISSSGKSYTSICSEIGGPGTAIVGKQSYSVTVGPICYMPPALGRCGRGGGADPGIELVQRFTQQCLDHDECCDVTGKNPPICGTQCLPEFKAAAPGFFFAPDCGTTAGQWIDNYGITYVLNGGDSSGTPESFSGYANVQKYGEWAVSGTRKGTGITFTAKAETYSASFTYMGSYTDCNVANGSWTNSANKSGEWSWNRTNTVGGAIMEKRSSPVSGYPASAPTE